MNAHERERLFNFVMIAAAFVLLLMPERNYVPIWDGRIFANCAMGAATDGLSLESLRCAGHPSQGYALLLALPQFLRLGDITLLHLTNVLLGILALASIRVVMGRVFPAREHARALDGLTVVCAVHPVLLSTLVQPNVDFGVYVFFFATLAALFKQAWRWVVLAGVFLCFSKETGVLAYGVMVGLAAAFAMRRDTGPLMDRLKRLRPRAVTLFPLVLFGVYVLWWNATHASSAIWRHQWQQGTMDGFKWFDLSEPVFLSYAAGLFVLGFGWVLTAIIASDAVVGGVRLARRQPTRTVAGADTPMLWYLTTLTVVLTYVLTAFRTWSNLRYFALLYPLFILLAFAALLRLGVGPRMRGVVIASLAALFVLAAFRSVDPLSRRVYGTFSVGQRDMYRMASITGEYRGPGRDQLVYNLEFTGFHAVQNALFRSMHPNDSTAYATARSVRWNIWSQLDERNWRRTMLRDGVIVPRYWDDEDLLATPAPPPVVWWLDFSYRPDADSSRERLSARYRQTAVLRTTVAGHTIVARKLERIAR